MICSMWWSITRFRGRWLHFEELGAGQIARNFETLGALDIIRGSANPARPESGHIVNISAAAVIANYAGFSI